MSKKGAEVVGCWVFCLGFGLFVCLFCFPFGAGNSIIDGNSAGFNNFQNET